MILVYKGVNVYLLYFGFKPELDIQINGGFFSQCGQNLSPSIEPAHVELWSDLRFCAGQRQWRRNNWCDARMSARWSSLLFLFWGNNVHLQIILVLVIDCFFPSTNLSYPSAKHYRSIRLPAIDSSLNC